MLKPKTLQEKTVSFLNERINDEYTAHYHYRNLSNILGNMGYEKAAAYFAKEAEDELKHALGIQQYLVGWNVSPAMMDIKPPAKVSGLVEGIESSYELEYDLFEMYTEGLQEALEAKDHATYEFLQQYIKIQTKAMAELATLINKLQLFDSGDKNFLFLFEQQNF